VSELIVMVGPAACDEDAESRMQTAANNAKTESTIGFFASSFKLIGASFGTQSLPQPESASKGCGIWPGAASADKF